MEGISPLMEFKPPFVDVTYHREEYIYKKHANGLLEGKYEKTPRNCWDLCCLDQPI